jgi:hypothetical protein
MCICDLRGRHKIKRQNIFIASSIRFVDRMSCSISAGAREISGQERPRDLNAIPRHEISLYYYQSLWSDTL